MNRAWRRYSRTRTRSCLPLVDFPYLVWRTGKLLSCAKDTLVSNSHSHRRASAPYNVDNLGLKHTIDAFKKNSGKDNHFLLVSSALITRTWHPIHILLNVMGGRVLTWKWEGKHETYEHDRPNHRLRRELSAQERLELHCCPPWWSQGRPGQWEAIDYRSRVSIISSLFIGRTQKTCPNWSTFSDKLNGLVSRADVARVCITALGRKESFGKTFEMVWEKTPATDAKPQNSKQLIDVLAALKVDQ